MSDGALENYKRQRRKISEKFPETLVSKQWFSVCSLSVLVFTTTLVTTSELASRVTGSESSIETSCNGLQLTPSDRALKYMILGASGSSCVIQLFRVVVSFFKANLKNTFSAYSIAFTIMSISFMGEVIMMTGNFDSICEDPFGVKSAVIQIAEWQTTVPMMLYLCLSLDTTKSTLGLRDYSILLAGYVGVLSGFMPILLSWQMGVCALIFSVVLVIYALVMNVVNGYYAYLSSVERGISNPVDYVCFAISRRRLQCSIYLFGICLFFPATFFSRVFIIIDTPTMFTIFSVLNFISKNLFAILLMEGHLEVLDPAMYQLLAEKTANATKRAFIRYVFHELRSPLNSLTMGVHVLLSGGELVHRKEIDAILIMSEASMQLAETLRNIQFVQRIDEQLLEVSNDCVEVDGLARRVAATYKDVIANKGISFRARIDHEVPTYISGDKALLEMVLANFVSNSIQFSDPGSQIDVSISLMQDELGDDCVQFLVRDNGRLLTSYDEKHMFLHYKEQVASLQALQGRPTIAGAVRSTVGPTICKDIVEKHGGCVGCRLGQQQQTTKIFFHVPVGCVDTDEEIRWHGINIEIVPAKNQLGGSVVTSVIPPPSPTQRLTQVLSQRFGITKTNESGGRMISSDEFDANNSEQQGQEQVQGQPEKKEQEKEQLHTIAPGIFLRPLPAARTTQLSRNEKTKSCSKPSANRIKDDGYAASFLPFLHAIAEVTSDDEGDGLHASLLSHSQSLVSSHGAPRDHLQVPPVGPLLRPISIPEDDADCSENEESSALNDAKNLVVLLVQGTLPHEKMLHTLLVKRGVECELAANESEALMLVQKHPGKYNLVFMENSIPNSDGIKATRTMRQVGFSSVILSLNSDSTDVNLVGSTNLDTDTVLPEPLSIQKIDSILSRARRPVVSVSPLPPV